MTEYPRCKTCKWAKQYDGPEFLTCDRISEEDFAGALPRVGVAVVGSFDNAVLYVSPSFGCVLHEPKAKE